MTQSRLLALQSTIMAVTTTLGRAVAWLTIALVLVTCTVVLLRYGFQWSHMALQEAIVYLHCIVFLLALAWTADADQHVRVDIFYRRFSPRQQAWVNCLGSLLFLLPFSLFLLWVTWPFFQSAWAIKEASAEAGGLPWVYWLKGLLPLAAASLVLQAIGQVVGNLGRLLTEASA